MAVFNKENKGYITKQYPLFLGDDLGLFDTVNIAYPAIEELYQKQMSQIWNELEIDLTQDRMDMQRLPKEVVDLMVKTISWQYLADSVAAKSIAGLLIPCCTNSELEGMLTAQSLFECLHPSHEVLTKTRGWVTIAEIEQNEEVAQFDTTNQEITFVKPSGYIKKHFKGNLLEFKNKDGHFNQLVTPNHRMVLHYPYLFKNETFKLAKDVNFHGSNAGIVSGLYSGGSRTEFTALDALYVAMQADGCFASSAYNGKRCGTIPYRFGFTKQRKIDRLYNICNELGFSITEYNVAGKIRRFTVDVPLEYHEPRSKTFDWFDLSDITPEWGQAFIKELVEWDGYDPTRNRDAVANYVKYCSTNFECISKAQAVAHLSGKGTHISELMVDDSRVPCYQLSITDKWYRIGNTISKKEIPYEGYVYCITVPTGAFLTRRGSIISVTGNCIHSRSYSHIVKQTFVDPNVLIEQVYNDVGVLQRSEAIVAAFNELESLPKTATRKEKQVALVKAFTALFALEAIAFMSSFAVTFAIAETDVFQGIGAMVALICRDEVLHTRMDYTVLDSLTKDPEWVAVIKEVLPQVKEILDAVVKQEVMWADYLFSEGRQVIGLNATLLKEYTLHMAKPVYDAMGVEFDFEVVKENPLPYMDKYIDPSQMQSAAQEINITSYNIGAIVNDTADVDLSFDF